MRSPVPLRAHTKASCTTPEHPALRRSLNSFGGRLPMERQTRPPNEFSRRSWKEPASLCDIYAGCATKVPDKRYLSRALAQLIPLNFPCRSLGQLLDELNLLRALVRRKPGLEMLHQLLAFRIRS